MENEKDFIQKLDEIEWAEPGTIEIEDILPYQSYSRLDLLCGFPWKPQFEISIGE